MLEALFDRNAKATLARVASTFMERTRHYGDTYRNCQHLTLRAAFKELTGDELPLKICSALACASFVDMKYQRNEGGYHEDSLIDGIAYQAFLAEEMRKLKEEQQSEYGGICSLPSRGRMV